MPDPAVDLNEVTLTCTLVKMLDYDAPWTVCEVKVCHPAGVTFVALHVPTDQYLRELEHLDIGSRLYAAGKLAYSRSERLEGQ